MSSPEFIKDEMIKSFGEAYHAFGLSRLMGYVVALLIFSPEPLSLDDISGQLGRSKGPVSQIARRLLDRNLIRKVMGANSRKDYYEVQPDIFLNAFRNTFELVKNNTNIARQLKARAEQANDDSLETFEQRLVQMQRFYELMEKHYQNFIDEWIEERSQLLKAS